MITPPPPPPRFDPRCNCGQPDCTICNAPVHRPWTPKPGVSPDEPTIAETRAKFERRVRQWERGQMIRRYILVLLMTGLGSLIGSAITIYLLT